MRKTVQEKAVVLYLSGGCVDGCLYRWVARWWSSFGGLRVHPLAAKKTLAKLQMVRLGRNNNFTTIRRLDDIIYR